jgi:hypothetical protein
MNEIATRFPCFGGECAVHAGGDGPLGTPADAGAHARRRLLAWHDRFTRFDPLSGPAGAAGWLPDGGVPVFDYGQHAVLPPPDTLDAWGETTMAA